MEKRFTEFPPAPCAGGTGPFAPLAGWLVSPVCLALLNVAVELRLPDVVARSGAVTQIAADLGAVRTESLVHVLDALAAAGLLRKEKSEYRNTPFTETYLRKDAPTYLGDLIVSLQTMQHKNLGRIKEFLFEKEPPAPAAIGLHDEEHWRRSLRGLAGYQKTSVAEAMAVVVESLPGAKNFCHMLDLGSGPGIIALRILERLPEMHLTLCDFPHALRMAEKEAAARGLGGRVTCLPGDYNRSDWGGGYDLVWACQSLYYVNELREFMRRVHAALRPGGFFVSIHEGVRDEGVEPAMLVLSRFSLALEGQDVSFPQGSIAAAAEEAGFFCVRREPFPMLFGDADLEIFRKPAAEDK